MKIIGVDSQRRTFIVELSARELDALRPLPKHREFDGYETGIDIDIMTRLAPTLEFERDKDAGPYMVGRIREAADQLEKAFAELGKGAASG